VDVQLNLVNQSNDNNNSQVVVFSAHAPPSNTIAWRVIENCGRGDNHPFRFPQGCEIGAADSWGNYSQRLNAPPGQAFAMTRTDSGDELNATGPASDPTGIQITNALASGAITALIFADGKLFASARLDPQQTELFHFRPAIAIGAMSQVTEGKVMDAAVLDTVDTRFDLTGIASADIVMTGGGRGEGSTPFAFALHNVVRA